MWRYRKHIAAAVSLLLIALIFVSTTLIKASVENFRITKVAVYASKNTGLISNDIFATIDDKAQRIEVVVPDGVDYKELTVTVDFEGKYILPEDAVWIEKNNPDRKVGFTNQTWELYDHDGNVKTYLIHAVNETKSMTEFKSFAFLKCDNNELDCDYICNINENRITTYVPLEFDCFKLVPTFATNGISVTCGEVIQKSGVTSNDFHNTLTYTVHCKNGLSDLYTVDVIPVDNGLKTLNIDCTEKIQLDELCRAQISLFDRNKKLVDESANIRVRGNYTSFLPKKGYKVIFDRTLKMTDNLLPSNNLVLLANYFDVSMMCHAAAFHIWKNAMNIGGFVPGYEYVNVFLNSTFCGTYMMTDQVEILDSKIEPGNVNVGSERLPGFAFLVQTVKEKGSFTTEHGLMLKLLNFDEITDDERNKIYEVIQDIEDSIFDGTFMQNEYIDIKSFSDWFVLNNIVRNTDAFYMASTYMYWSKDNKLTVGPIWDFDLGFGNADSDTYEGFVAVNNTLISQMLKNDEFNKLVRLRWSEISPKLQNMLYDFFDTQYAVIKPAMQQNFDVWNGCEDTDEKIRFIKQWVKNRIAWLDKEWGLMDE